MNREKLDQETEMQSKIDEKKEVHLLMETARLFRFFVCVSYISLVECLMVCLGL
jgi:hypothetical protein